METDISKLKKIKFFIKKYFLNGFSLFLFFIILIGFTLFKFLHIPFSEYHYYTTNKCRSIFESQQISENEIAFLLTDTQGNPLTCKNIRIEAEIDTCIESPCPDFVIALRMKTSKEGKIVVKKNVFTKEIMDYFESEPKLVLRDKKQYLFHAEGNYNLTVPVIDIFTSSTQNTIIHLPLKKEDDKECLETVRKSFKRNYCDGY